MQVSVHTFSYSLTSRFFICVMEKWIQISPRSHVNQRPRRVSGPCKISISEPFAYAKVYYIPPQAQCSCIQLPVSHACHILLTTHLQPFPELDTDHKAYSHTLSVFLQLDAISSHPSQFASPLHYTLICPPWLNISPGHSKGDKHCTLTWAPDLE